MEALRNRPKTIKVGRRIAQHEESSPFTLANIIGSARMIVVAPLATAAYQIPLLIAGGNYSSAIKCALVSSACFLILATSTTVADFLNYWVHRTVRH